MFKRTIKQYETAILWRHGSVERLLPAGRHRVLPFTGRRLERFDMRVLPLLISGQEIILADRTSLKINIAGTYKLADPVLRVRSVATDQLHDYMNQLIQLALRAAVSEYTLDKLFSDRRALNEAFATTITAGLADIGLEVIDVSIKDVILPSDLRAAYVEAASAQARSRAHLEQARGQSAALRHMANAASLLEKHPQLIQLLSIQKTDKATASQVNLHFTDKA